MDKVECPYCGHDNEVDHDDGINYSEDKFCEQECEECEKTFLISTSISFYHEGHIAPCKNGGEHDWQDIHGYPTEHFEGRKRCSYCDEEKDFLTVEERKKKTEEYYNNN